MTTSTPLSVIERRQSHAALLVALAEAPPSSLHLDDLRVLATGEFRRGGNGYYPSVRALLERTVDVNGLPFGPEARFVVGDLVHVDDTTDPRRRWKLSGNNTWDLTFDEAIEVLHGLDR